MATTSALGPGTPIPVDYTSRDYQSLRSDLLNAVPSYLPEWTSTNVSGLGMTLLELFAYVGDIENYYIDRVANEAFLATAQLRSSILNLAYLIDYAPGDATPASAVLTLTLNPNSPSFTLPVGAQFATAGSPGQAAVVFELADTHTFPANNTSSTAEISSTVENGVSVPLTVVQGITVANESVGTSSGAANQQYTLFNTGVIVPAVQVFVDEGLGPKPWAQIGDLIDAGPYDAVYSVAEDANGVFYIVFGDGASGRIPNPSAAITSTYRVGGGVIGNVGAGQITVNLSGSANIVAVTNPSSAVGGAEPETIPQIQANAPKSLTAAGRCVSEQDYASVALTYPGVSKASSVASGSSVAVNLYIHPAGGPYTQSQLAAQVAGLGADLTWGGPSRYGPNNVTGYLDGLKQIGASIVVLPPQVDNTAVGYVQIVIAMTVQVLPNYLASQVEQDVLNALNTLFDFGSMDFGARLTLSSVYHASQAVPGVDYCTVSQMYRADQAAGLGDIICAPSELAVVTSPDTGLDQLTVTTTGGL
jgi:hypothetical protein